METEFTVSKIKLNISEALANQNIGGVGGNNSEVQYGIQVNPCYSSPLFMDPNTRSIPSIAKVPFVQGFINLLRNKVNYSLFFEDGIYYKCKVTRVDLLSSGFGFVISVNDLEDCV